MNRGLIALLIGCLGLSYVSTANAAKPACSFPGVYSTLALDKKTGDISGDEIIITISPEGHEVIFTEAQGNFPIKPIVSDATVEKDWISFQIAIGTDTLKIKAKPSCKYLETHFEWSTGSSYVVNLPRTKSFWDTSDGNRSAIPGETP
jgi:hypothetical protein